MHTVTKNRMASNLDEALERLLVSDDQSTVASHICAVEDQAVQFQGVVASGVVLVTVLRAHSLQHIFLILTVMTTLLQFQVRDIVDID